MRFWTIAYQEKKSQEQYPIYEGTKDGRYYLGGSISQLYPLLFSTKKDAEKAKERVDIVERDAKDGRSWVENGKFVVVRCSIEI